MAELLTLLEEVGLPALAAAAAAAILVAAFGLPWNANRRVLVAVGAALGVGVGFFLGCAVLSLQSEWFPRDDESALYSAAPAATDGASETAAPPERGWLERLQLSWPPKEDRDRFLLILLPAVVLVELLVAVLRLWPILAWLLRLIVAGAAARVLLHGSVYLVGTGEHTWSALDAWLILAGMGAALALVWFLLVLLTGRPSGRIVPLALALSCAAAGLTLMLSGYASGGKLGFPLAAALLGVGGVLLVVNRAGLVPAAGVGLVCLFALLVTGRFFGNLTTTHALLLGLAPLACWLGELPRPLRWLVQVVLVAVPLGLAVSQARDKFIEDSRPRPPAPRVEPETPTPSVEDYENFKN